MHEAGRVNVSAFYSEIATVKKLQEANLMTQSKLIYVFFRCSPISEIITFAW